MKRIAALLLCFAMLCGCTAEDKREYESAKMNEYIKIEAREEESELWIGCDEIGGVYCSLWSECDGDVLISDLINARLLTKDRQGEIVCSAVEGETRSYNGEEYEYTGIADLKIEKTTDGGAEYTWTLARDVYFSDGKQLTADDVIFTLALVCGSEYDGCCGMSGLDIEGLYAYNAGVDEATCEKYKKLAENYYENPSDNPDEKEKWFYDTAMPEAWHEECEAIIDYCLRFAEGHGQDIGFSCDEIYNSEPLACAFAMYMWGFAKYNNGFITGVGTGRSIQPENADIEFFTSEASTLYPDADEFMQHEATGTESVSIKENAVIKFIRHFGAEESRDDIKITGIEKTDDYTVKVRTESYKFTDVFAMDIPVLPLHYYGDESKFDPEHGKYGFESGDIEKIKEKCLHPVGAGVYCIYESEDEGVKLRANKYSSEKPETAYVRITAAADGSKCITSGSCDLYFGSDTGGSYYESYENTGYGYIGINCENVCVGEEPYSESSCALRTALCAVIASCRGKAAEYFGGGAVETSLCVCRDSWAYSDAGADYTESDALSIAIGKLRNAGYEWDADEGKFISAPEGAEMEYTIIIPGDGKGEHPSYETAQRAAQLLSLIGIELKISDITDTAVLYNALEKGTVQLWAAAWSNTASPDLYQLFSSENIPGSGTGLNYCRLKTEELDRLLTQARESVSSEIRSSLYARCLEIIYSQGAEVPLYRRLGVLYCGNRVDADSICPITAYYPADNIIKNIKMK